MILIFHNNGIEAMLKLMSIKNNKAKGNILKANIEEFISEIPAYMFICLIGSSI